MIPTQDPRIGELIQHRYRITGQLAAGGMGLVYRGERTALGRPVAIKFLHAAIAADPAVRARFENEARAASKMHHPNVVGVIDCGIHRGEPFVVMELVPGRSLRELAAEGPLSVPRTLRLFHQILAGLAHAHSHGVIHRDLKPDNILVWSDDLGEHAQISDFGLAKRLEEGEIDGRSRDLAIGTPSYMSPEQTLGDAVDARSDLYGAGVVLFELLTERKPYRSPHMFETLRMHREAPIPFFSDVAPDHSIPAELEGVVRRALAKSPAARYRTAGDFAVALDDAMLTAHERSDEIDVSTMIAAAGHRTRWQLVAALVVCAVIAYVATVKLDDPPVSPDRSARHSHGIRTR